MRPTDIPSEEVVDRISVDWDATDSLGFSCSMLRAVAHCCAPNDSHPAKLVGAAVENLFVPVLVGVIHENVLSSPAFADAECRSNAAGCPDASAITISVCVRKAIGGPTTVCRDPSASLQELHNVETLLPVAAAPVPRAYYRWRPRVQSRSPHAISG